MKKLDWNGDFDNLDLIDLQDVVIATGLEHKLLNKILFLFCLIDIIEYLYYTYIK